jgi:diguanylate cyclase (GGDEF)-like protein
MSFRTRLTGFFVVIVVVPMIAVGGLVYSLISHSERSKAEARANGVATAAASLYTSEETAARADARMIGRNLGSVAHAALPRRVATLAAQAGLARLKVTLGSGVVADIGDRTAVAPGTAEVSLPGGRTHATVVVSEITAAQYARMLAGPDVAAVVRQEGRTLASTLTAASVRPIPRQGTVKVAGLDYQTATFAVPGFDGLPLTVTALSGLSATASSIEATRLLAALFILAFLLLAFAFSVFASRALQGQVSRFLQAARRLAGGDFSAPVPIAGQDEFAALGQEFNNMSNELARRLDELSQERARLRESIRRIGQTLAANLDASALLELALGTAVDAVQAGCGRASARADSGGGLEELASVGDLTGFEEEIAAAEQEALRTGHVAEQTTRERSVLSLSLGPLQSGGPVHGVLTVARGDQPFSEDERELLQSLAAQAALALENVGLHFQVRRQAVTDELTGLANHGRFQELLEAEAEQIRRYHHPLGLIMLDIDDFKAINDTYGHLQGDLVLKAVARVVKDNSREADTPARYGGEEMALILPHTDLDGAHAIAERVRLAIEALRIPRLDGEGTLATTASVGVSASRDGTREALIADADAALYEAKHQGKNRTVSAPSRAANVPAGE